MYQSEEKESLEVFSVYIWNEGSKDFAHIEYVSAYTQEEADQKCRDQGKDVFDSNALV